MKKTYGQNWPAYNRAQENEKADFMNLLRDLCSGLPEVKQSRGRPKTPLPDILFCMLFTVYCRVSCRRIKTDLRIAKRDGLISRVPSLASVLRGFEKAELQQILVQLILQSSRPLQSVEKTFAIDSTGFSTAGFGRWIDFRYGRMEPREKRRWIKAHLMCGVQTNIVTGVEVTDAYAGDALYFERLLDMTTENFQVVETIGDKAYSSLANFKYADSKRVRLITPFKVNAKPVHGTGDPLWTRLYHFYSLNKEWFNRRYHKRSNAESTNAMIKGKFGERLRSRTRKAQFNELLCKVLCHNICVTVHAYYELGIEPRFWDGSERKAA
jgi:transposase